MTDKYLLAHKDTDVALISIILNQNGFSHKIISTYLKLPLFGDNFFIFKKDYIDWYCHRKMWYRMVEAIFEKIEKERNFSQKILNRSYEVGGKLKNDCYKVLNNKNKILNYQEWRKIISLYDELLGLGVVAPVSDIQHFRLTRTMEEIISKKIGLHRLKRPLNTYLLILNKHTKELQTNRSEKELIRLAEKFSKEKRLKKLVLIKDLPKIKKYLVKNYPSLYQKVQKYLNQYRWINFAHLGPEMTLDSLILKIRELVTSKKSLQDLKKKFSSLKRLKFLQKKYQKELRLNEREKQIFKTAHDFSENKAYRAEMMSLTYFTLRQALKLLAKKYNYSIKELLCLTHFEFLDLLKKGKLVKKSLLRERQKFCVSYVKKYNEIGLYIGKKAKLFVKKWLPREKIKKEKIIKGTTASLGKVRGAVKIINSATEMKKMKMGDILVATQTTPQLLPAMKKAAAFVTDVGGITSHAAIIARELKVPCLIGTWVATKILKDGDLVEVDAYKGIVKLLK